MTIDNDRRTALTGAARDADERFDATPLQNPVQPCPSCSCCVTGLRMENIQKVITETRAGHTFDLVVEVTFAPGAGSGAQCDCTLEWNETCDDPAFKDVKANVKTDLWQLHPESSTFMNWKMRRRPCPAGGKLSVTMMDDPSIDISLHANRERTLQFELTVRSCTTCGCKQASRTVKATQTIKVAKGQVIVCTLPPPSGP